MTLRHRSDNENASPASYTRHMASDAWTNRKVLYYSCHPRRCACCGATRDLHVHHKTYARFGAELDTDLVCLCATCHSTVHQYHGAVGGSLADATERVLKHLRQAAAEQRRERRTRAPRKRVQTTRDRRGRTVEKPSWLVVVSTTT